MGNRFCKTGRLSRQQLQVLIVKSPYFSPPVSLKLWLCNALVLRCCPSLIYEDDFEGSYSKLHGPLTVAQRGQRERERERRSNHRS